MIYAMFREFLKKYLGHYWVKWDFLSDETSHVLARSHFLFLWRAGKHMICPCG